MPDRCVVYGCTSGYDSTLKKKGQAGISMFKIPEAQRADFQKKLKLGRELKKNDRVCSLHFYERDIERSLPDLIINGKVVRGSPLKNPRLKAGALPHIFPNCPKYMTTPEKPMRAPPRERSQKPAVNKNLFCNEQKQEISVCHEPQPQHTLVIGEGIVQSSAPSENLPEPTGSTSAESESISAQPSSSNQFDIMKIKLPNRQWAVTEKSGTFMITKIDYATKFKVTHGIRIAENKVNVEVNGKPIKVDFTLEDKKGLENFVGRIDLLKPCEGSGYGYSTHCVGWVSKRASRCFACKGMKNSIDKKKRRQTLMQLKVKLRNKYSSQSRKQTLQNLKRSKQRLKSKVQKLKMEVADLKKKCSEIKHSKLKELISTLPQAQQDMVLSCYRVSKAKGPQGRRYELNWIYECILMRIKSPALYDHIRLRQILPLPSRGTICRYMRKLHPTYGYQQTLFQTLSKKVSGWSEVQRHGAILVDEMKIQSGVSYDKHTLEMCGFVDLGENTPDKMKTELGDHVLVVQFVPFQGKWNQVLACFLAKGNVKGKELAKIILEGVTLCENSGLRVDAVTADGAAWNHNMWSEYGVSEENSSCVHPCNEIESENNDSNDRRLYFFSDWCHLLKCMRNNMCPLPPRKKSEKKKPEDYVEEEEAEIDNPATTTQEACKRKSTSSIKRGPSKQPRLSNQTTNQNLTAENIHLHKTLHTPDGLVQRQHWIALWRHEEDLQKKNKLRYVPNINEVTIFPQGFQRMNVGQAYKFFSDGVAAGMATYRKDGKYGFKDSEPTEKFIQRIANLAKAMNSGGPKGALWEGCKEEKDIEEYLEYHKQCMKLAGENGRAHFWSGPTDKALTMTLTSTLHLSRYLRSIGFRFVMTKRFNQDALEQFFGNIRRAAAPNPHPDPKLFAQLFRLLCMYSLVSPAKGSNVSGVTNVETLLSADDKVGEKIQEKFQDFDRLLDEILVYGSPLEDFLEAHTYQDHNYGSTSLDLRLNQFMAGFTAARQKAVCQGCSGCMESIFKSREEACEVDSFIQTKEKYGGYSFPTDSLASLIGKLECAASDCMARHGVHKEMIFTTLKYIKIDASNFVGCPDHCAEVTKKVIKFYLRARMHFTADMKNAQDTRKKELAKTLRKQSKNV